MADNMIDYGMIDTASLYGKQKADELYDGELFKFKTSKNSAVGFFMRGFLYTQGYEGDETDALERLVRTIKTGWYSLSRTTPSFRCIYCAEESSDDSLSCKCRD